MLRVPLENSVPLHSHWKITAGGLALEVHFNTNPVLAVFDVSRRKETNTTGSSRWKKNIENQFRKEMIENRMRFRDEV